MEQTKSKKFKLAVTRSMEYQNLKARDLVNIRETRERAKGVSESILLSAQRLRNKEEKGVIFVPEHQPQTGPRPHDQIYRRKHTAYTTTSEYFHYCCFYLFFFFFRLLLLLLPPPPPPSSSTTTTTTSSSSSYSSCCSASSSHPHIFLTVSEPFSRTKPNSPTVMPARSSC